MYMQVFDENDLNEIQGLMYYGPLNYAGFAVTVSGDRGGSWNLRPDRGVSPKQHPEETGDEGTKG
jgi:hypothetical protein